MTSDGDGQPNMSGRQTSTSNEVLLPAGKLRILSILPLSPQQASFVILGSKETRERRRMSTNSSLRVPLSTPTLAVDMEVTDSVAIQITHC